MSGLRLNVTSPQMKLYLRINGTVLVGAVGLAAFYLTSPENKEQILSALCSVLAEWSMTVRNITIGSLVVELHCHSPESFLQFFDDYELGNVGQRLSEEFSKTGIEEVTVEIENNEVVLRQREVIR